MRIKNKVDVLMNYFMKLPNDMFQQQLLQYVTVYDIVFLDNACMNHRYRSQLLDKISGVILIGDLINALSWLFISWVGKRKIFLRNMRFNYKLHGISSRFDVGQLEYVKNISFEKKGFSIIMENALIIY